MKDMAKLCLDEQIKPDFDKTLKQTIQLEDAANDLELKICSFTMVSDFGKENTTKAENKLIKILMGLYAIALVLVAAEFIQKETETLRWAGTILSSFGIAIFYVVIKEYFKVLKTISGILGNYIIRGPVQRNLNHIHNAIKFITAYSNCTTQEQIIAKQKTLIKLQDIQSKLEKIEKELKGFRLKRSETKAILEFLGSSVLSILALSGITFYLKLLTENMQIIGAIPVILFLVIALLFLLPSERTTILLGRLNVIRSNSTVSETVNNLIKSLLGDEVSETALNSLMLTE
jgi:hypothetical protein